MVIIFFIKANSCIVSMAWEVTIEVDENQCFTD